MNLAHGFGPEEPPSDMASVMERNITTLLARSRREDRERRLQDRISDTVTRFTGSMTFVFLHLALFGLWIVINLGWTPLPEFDPTFVVLAMFASVEAIFLSTFVLITQNRMAEQASKRADLDLQVSLLAEHEITRLMQLVTLMAERMGLEEAHHPELRELQQDVHPEQVLDELDRVNAKKDE